MIEKFGITINLKEYRNYINNKDVEWIESPEIFTSIEDVMRYVDFLYNHVFNEEKKENDK